MAPITKAQYADAAADPSNAVFQTASAQGQVMSRPAVMTYATVLGVQKTWKDDAEYSDFLQSKFNSLLPVTWHTGDGTDPKVFADAVKAFQVSWRDLLELQCM